MARINKEDILELSTQELVDRIAEETLQYRKMKFAHAVSALENPLELRWLRRDIARLKTELQKRKNDEQTKES